MLLDILILSLMVGGIIYYESTKEKPIMKYIVKHKDGGKSEILYGYGTISKTPINVSQNDFEHEKKFIYIYYDKAWYATKFDDIDDFYFYMKFHSSYSEEDLINLLLRII